MIGKRLYAWAIAHPASSAAILTLLSFIIHLYDRQAGPLHHDAKFYWELAGLYWQSGQFELLAFNNNLRGYLFPLLLAPLTRLAEQHQWVPMDTTRAIGAVTAALLFGVVVPGIWQAAQKTEYQRVIPLGRRLLFGLLGFLFWRGYFHYSMTDFIAVLALVAGLWRLLKGHAISSGLLAGALIAAAVNFRPIYAASLPFAVLLCLWPVSSRTANASNTPLVAWGRRLAFVIGAGLVFAPQLAINQAHFGINSPLVLTKEPKDPSLYLAQLQWGLSYQKYETNIGTDYPKAQMFFMDPQGTAIWTGAGFSNLDSYAQYWHIIQQAPMAVASVWFRHLFNGLDVQYPTPYIKAVYVPTWGLAWLNYTILFGGLCVAGYWAARGGASRITVQTWLVLIALLAPCLATLPVAMECRFLMPLHLLLCAALAFGAHPIRAWRAATARRRLSVAILYAGVVVGCFALSASTQKRLESSPRYLFQWQRPTTQPW